MNDPIERAAKAIHDERYYGLSQACRDLRWDRIRGTVEGHMYIRCARAAAAVLGFDDRGRPTKTITR